MRLKVTASAPDMNKPHLVLVHSFPTNSILLHGLTEFLSDFFVVHFIDLPGFHKNSPPSKGRITLEKFSKYFDQKISELKVDQYIVGGVSFGFLVVNNAKLDHRCRAVLAMEPFVNTECLNISFFAQKKYLLITFLLRIVSFLNLEKVIWKSDWFNKYLQKESDYSKDRVDTIIDSIDARTFFAVTSLLLNYKNKLMADNSKRHLATVEQFLNHGIVNFNWHIDACEPNDITTLQLKPQPISDDEIDSEAASAMVVLI